MISASLESSGPGDSDSLHLQLLPFLTGRDSSVGEGGDPNQKEEFPPGGACLGSQRPLVSACPHLPKALSWPRASPLLALGLPGWSSFLLFTVKVSFTKTQGLLLFSSFCLVDFWLLPPTSTGSSLTASNFEAGLLKESEKWRLCPETQRKMTGPGQRRAFSAQLLRLASGLLSLPRCGLHP